ncbi:MAG: EF-P beta-lysylation protein EpmB, partial [Planctomycetota bacterium]
ARLVETLEAIPHVTTLRLHTRLPVVIPRRATLSLSRLLSQSRLDCVIVLHINHANEIDEALKEAIARLRESGALLLNQSVLLRGINDSTAVLADLSDRLIAAGVLPYYLHELDAVSGVNHFRVARTTGETLIADLRKRLPGYAVPRFVAEEAGKPHKTLLA